MQFLGGFGNIVESARNLKVLQLNKLHMPHSTPTSAATIHDIRKVAPESPAELRSRSFLHALR
jgi:hypothetical protein